MKFIKLNLVNTLENESLAMINDQNRLTQVIINLVSNALKFSTKITGVIDIILRRAGVNLIEISIQDNGIGMKQENIDKLGNIFFTHNSNNKNNHGIGLGLYISSKLIKM